MSRRWLGLTAALLTAGNLTGCCGECCRPGPPVPYAPPSRGPAVPAGPLGPPPPNWQGGPPGVRQPAPPATLAPPVPAEQPAPPPEQGVWKPSPRDEIRLSPPIPATPEGSPNGARAENPLVQPSTPPAPVTPTLPVGIPQFTNAKGKVAAGLTPLGEGFDWLKANGFKTVLFLRQPGADDTRERQQAEQRGLVFRTLDVAPETLAKATVEDFNRLVDDPANQPLFVYDRNGIQAGAMWYLHFRTAEQATDQMARDQAERLGLAKDPAGDQLTMWLAVQKLLSQ